MANQRMPRDPDRSNPARNPDRYYPATDDLGEPARRDDDLQVDPQLAERPASGGRIALFAVAIALILGAVFYGLNSTSFNHAGTSSTAQNTSQSSPPAAPPGMRDVTPHANTQPGTTTGAAPTPPRTSAPSSNEANHSVNPPAGSAAPASPATPGK
jgi:hypothetical protein